MSDSSSSVSAFGEVASRLEASEQRGRDQIHAGIGALRGEDGGDQELQWVLVVERGGRFRIERPQALVDWHRALARGRAASGFAHAAIVVVKPPEAATRDRRGRPPMRNRTASSMPPGGNRVRIGGGVREDRQSIRFTEADAQQAAREWERHRELAWRRQ